MSSATATGGRLFRCVDLAALSMMTSVTLEPAGIPEDRRRFRQLMVVRHNPDLGPTTVHMLVRSTAPTNAEAPALTTRDGDRDRHLTDPKELLDETEEALGNLSCKLKDFIRSNPRNPAIKIALNIHGYSTPLLNFANQAYEVSDAKFSADIRKSSQGKQYGDFVIFIDFSWPSEQALSLSPIRTIRAMPVALWIVLAVALPLAMVGGGCSLFAGALLGLVSTLILLRLVTYFRDRDRAAAYGAYDAVEMIRYLHELIGDLVKGKTDEHYRIELNLLAHSMGGFVATQAIRTLCDVFDPGALRRWRTQDGSLSLGPFDKADPCASQNGGGTASSLSDLSGIGTIFQLGRLVLASPDIPIWALSSGRSNPLLAAMRRFKEVFIFTNDSDMVLRLASTLANFFVFPSGTQQGGFRLGNVVDLLERSSSQPQPWGGVDLGFGQIGLYAPRSGLRGERRQALLAKPFFARLASGAQLRLINCTDYIDGVDIFNLMKTKPSQERQKQLVQFLGAKIDKDTFATSATPRLAAAGQPGSFWRYASTFVQHFVAKRLDSHGGYFQGPFCLGLLYGTLLNGSKLYTEEKEDLGDHGLKIMPSVLDDLQRHQVTWVTVIPERRC